MGATGYQWTFTSPTAPPPKPERLVQASSATLNPGSGNYTVTMRYRTTKHFGNIVQKGQAGSAGGYFKLENPGGHLNCVFRGMNSSGAFLRKAVESPAVSATAHWHVAVCARTRERPHADRSTAASSRRAKGSTGTSRTRGRSRSAASSTAIR